MTETALVPSQRDLILAGPVGSLDAYVQTVKAIPVLSRQEELELARKFLDENDLDAARALVMSQLRFVVHIARSYAGYGLPIGDLIQDGNIGLMKAVKRFDPEVGVRLITYAVHWIRAEIHEFVLRNWRLVKVATTKAQRKLFFNLRKAKKNLGWLSAEETEAVAEDLGVSPHEVTEMESRLSSYDLSFDPTPDADEESTYAPAMYLPNSELNPADALETENTAQHASAGLQDALESLDQRSREILQARWLTEQKETLHTLADRYGVSAERIRQIEAAAIRKLRAEIAPA
jgi:RNA polymerase sigma-32 factor